MRVENANHNCVFGIAGGGSQAIDSATVSSVPRYHMSIINGLQARTPCLDGSCLDALQPFSPFVPQEATVPLESATYISQLVPTNPPGTDGLNQADDHLRLIKQVLQTTFPNVNSAANLSSTDLTALASAWASYTPVASGSTGTAGGATSSCAGKYLKIGKTCLFRAAIQWTNIGSWTGTTVFTLPFTDLSGVPGHMVVGRDVGLTGAMLSGVLNGSGTVQLFRYDNAFVLAAGGTDYAVTGFFETT
jgi:hypothetical protein